MKPLSFFSNWLLSRIKIEVGDINNVLLLIDADNDGVITAREIVDAIIECVNNRE